MNTTVENYGFSSTSADSMSGTLDMDRAGAAKVAANTEVIGIMKQISDIQKNLAENMMKDYESLQNLKYIAQMFAGMFDEHSTEKKISKQDQLKDFTDDIITAIQANPQLQDVISEVLQESGNSELLGKFVAATFTDRPEMNDFANNVGSGSSYEMMPGDEDPLNQGSGTDFSHEFVDHDAFVEAMNEYSNNEGSNQAIVVELLEEVFEQNWGMDTYQDVLVDGFAQFLHTVTEAVSDALATATVNESRMENSLRAAQKAAEL